MKERNPKLLKKFGKRLKELRVEKRLSQEALANEAEIPISQVGRIERGEVNTTLITLKGLADALGIQLAELLKM